MLEKVSIKPIMNYTSKSDKKRYKISNWLKLKGLSICKAESLIASMQMKKKIYEEEAFKISMRVEAKNVFVANPNKYKRYYIQVR